MSKQSFIFAGGGTGGHLYPGLAVAAALQARSPAATITFYTTSRALDRDLLQRTQFAQQPQEVRPFSTKPWRWPAFWLAWRRSVSAAVEHFRRERPAAVLGLGGYAAGPPVAAARKLGIRCAILNPDAIPGRANRFLAPRVDLVAMQWDVSRRYFASGAPCRVMGCPIRAEFKRVSRIEGCARFGLDPDRPTLLVTGASQGARTINQTMQRVWPRFVEQHGDWQMLHLTGSDDEAECRAAYASSDSSAVGGGVATAVGSAVKVMAFTHEMAWALAAADLVIARAGASTLAELTALGKPAILLPYPYHRDKHQHANAHVLVDAGAAVLIDDTRDAELNAEPVLTALRRLADRTTRELMASAARSLGRVDAADAIAEWMAGGAGNG